VKSAKSRPKGGDVRHIHRQIDQRMQAARLQQAREQAIIRYVYWKRG
jgi:hypothetical protein